MSVFQSSLADSYINDYQLVDTIGKGAYGIIFKVLNRNDGKFYAMKMLVNNRRSDKQVLLEQLLISHDKHLALPSLELESNTIEEINLHWKVRSHPNVVSIIDVFTYRSEATNDKFTFTVMDFLPTDLFSVMVDTPMFVNNSGMIKKVFIQLCSALNYCHSKGVYHCDIKPENILLDDDCNIYLCDFGLATGSEFLVPYGSLGSSYYMSPERMTGQSQVSIPTSKSDVWSAGIILVNLIFTCNLWSRANVKVDDVFRQFNEDKTVLSRMIPVSEELYQLLIRVFEVNPYDRISMEELLFEVKNLTSFTSTGLLSNVEPLSDEQFFSIIGTDFVCDVTLQTNQEETIAVTTSQIILAADANYDLKRMCNEDRRFMHQGVVR